MLKEVWLRYKAYIGACFLVLAILALLYLGTFLLAGCAVTVTGTPFGQKSHAALYVVVCPATPQDRVDRLLLSHA